MWNDMRTKDDVPIIKKNLINYDTVGILKIISTGSPAANLLWLKSNEEDNWYVKKFLQVSSFDDLMKMVDAAGLGTGELLFYPHLTGDKTIYADPTIRGAFLGLNTNHTREDLAVAVMEGVCFAVKQLAQATQLSREELSHLKVTGGASSMVWMQILADHCLQWLCGK